MPTMVGSGSSLGLSWLVMVALKRRRTLVSWYQATMDNALPITQSRSFCTKTPQRLVKFAPQRLARRTATNKPRELLSHNTFC